MIGRALHREVERDLHADARAGCDRSAGNPPACRAPDARRRGRRRRCRWRRGCRDRRGRPSARCCGPCGWCGRSDGSAGNRRRRSPSPRYPAAARCNRWNVPCWPGNVPWLRGTISYQAPARAGAIDHEREQLRSRQVGPLLARGHARPSAHRSAAARLRRSAVILALLEDHGGCGLLRRPALWSAARALERIEADVGAGLLLELEPVPPGCEFVGPGFDGIHIAAGLGRARTSRPSGRCRAGSSARAAIRGRARAPDQCGGNDIMAVAVDVSPDLDALADDALHRVAPAVDQRDKRPRYGKRCRRSRQFELSYSR